jgi:outer membrane protein assembly factor BamD
MRYFIWPLYAFLFLIFVGCGSSKDSTALTPDERWERAQSAFINEDYLDAIEDLKIITLQFQGSGYGDSAQMMLAESYYRRKEYILAQYEFENLIRSRAGSKLLPRARYKLGMCFYRLSSQSSLDQQNTRRAIDAFQTYIEYSPADSLVPDVEGKIRELNNKLAEREFTIAELYMTMEYYRAAVIYYDVVLEKFHDSDLADDAQLGKARAMFMRKKYPEARDEITRYLTRYPSSDRRGEGEKLQKDIETKLSASTTPGKR